MKYKVYIQEVHVLPMEVEAKDEETARNIAQHKYNQANFDLSNLEYSHTNYSKDWRVEKIEN
jgi:hypothetical protein